MKIFSLNVNGLRAFDEKSNISFNDFCLNTLKADIICLQEIKGSKENLTRYSALKDYQTFSSILVKGRHGVATLVRKNVFCEKKVEISKGRILKTFHRNFVLYNCYMPYCDETGNGDKGDIIKVYNLLREHAETENCILCGDFNATYSILDHYQYKNELDTITIVNKWDEDIYGNEKNKDLINDKIKEKNKLYKRLVIASEEFADPGILKEMTEKIRPKKVELPFHFFTVKALETHFFSVYQREWMKEFVSVFKDTFRMYNNEIEQYTCWNTIFNLRPVNYGTRIDYVLCTSDILCCAAGIMPEIKGSDHCPVYAEFKIENFVDDRVDLSKRKNNLLDFFERK